MTPRRRFLNASAIATAAMTLAGTTALAATREAPPPGSPGPARDAGPRPRRRLGRTELEIAPLVLGTNVFGWTTDRKRSFELLDRFVDAGLQAVDTADMYSNWVDGNRGGESERIIGDWIQARRRRHDIVLITKVGLEMEGRSGLAPAHIERGVEDSLRRLRTDHIDLFFSHAPDPRTPHDETLAAYQRLIKAGKIRAIGASNFAAGTLRDALDASTAKGLPRYEVIQPRYNLYDRDGLDGPLLALARAEGLGVITFSSLASGFLTGKYRSEADLGQSQRGGGISRYLNDRGRRILQALDTVAARHGAAPAEVALAWIVARDGVTAPIASSTSLEQLDSQIRALDLALTADDLAVLDRASARAG